MSHEDEQLHPDSIRLRQLYEAIGQVVDGDKELNITRLYDFLGQEDGLPVEALLCDPEPGQDDTDRLDFMIEKDANLTCGILAGTTKEQWQICVDDPNDDHCILYPAGEYAWFDSPRAAIDAAIAAMKD